MASPSLDVSKPTELVVALHPGRNQTPDSVHALAVSPDGQTLAAATGSEIELWRRTEKGWKKPDDFRANILHSATTMSFGGRGHTLVVSGGLGNRGEVHLFDVNGERPLPIAKIKEHKSAVVSVSASSDGKFIASADKDGRVIVSSTTGQKLHEWTFPGPVNAVAFAPDGRHLALGNGDGTVYILRLAAPTKK